MFIEFTASNGMTAADIKSVITINTEHIVHFRVKMRKYVELRLTSTVVLFCFNSPEKARRVCEQISEKINFQNEEPLNITYISLDGSTGARLLERGEWIDL